MKAALLQITSSEDPVANLAMLQARISEAAGYGAGYVLTPEVSNCVSASRSHQNSVLQLEEDDATLAGLRESAREHGIWLTIGSLALKTGDPDGRFANRQFLIDPEGEIRARYDKIHMFDVQVSAEETYRESAGYRPGAQAVVAQTPFAKIGLTICYDVRFPSLHARLAQAGAEVITVPAAFSRVTGAAHWHVLLRARAIETGCWILAPGQCGENAPKRKTYGHSLVVAPWGEIVAEAGVDPETLYVDLDRDQVAEARRRVPSLTHGTEFDGPIAK
ncbi:carbon-nitrogen hydrolase family protein [Cognatishimia sp.]|uniref:carbon-nitrogen hydrolase family protein n=1 Tax=Cognatishimia sp. TaxID=2211648 RepID=UPI003517693E|nr:carbon-nitrogen hydrolase family protein [Cognatishimia sp.]